METAAIAVACSRSIGAVAAEFTALGLRIEGSTPPKISDFTGGQSNFVTVDVCASHGVFHVLDRVLLPNLN